MRTLGHRVPALAVGALGAAMSLGCAAEEGARVRADAGVPEDAQAQDADAGDDWDPVWHVTRSKPWETLGPEYQPDCGVGCRMLLNIPVPNPGYYSFAYDTQQVLGEGFKVGPVLSAIDSTSTSVVGPPYENDDALVEPYVLGHRASFLRNLGVGRGNVEVEDLVTGERKIAYTYTPAEAGKNNVTRTALSSRYVFWAMDGKGLMSRDLQTGEVKLWLAGSYLCHDICATEHELICAEIGVVYVVDLDTGEAGFLDDGGALQVEGFCSPDRTQFVWIDYRDPPGQNSNYDFERSGGEVYVRDLTTKKTRRVTYDSPVRPRGKIFPAVDGTRVYWNEAPDGPNENPAFAEDLYWETTMLVRFDLATGQKCKLERFSDYKAAFGSKLATLWLDSALNETRLVLLDLDNPALGWQCETVPIPP